MSFAASADSWPKARHPEGLPRPEYPRPQFVRSEWLNLNGKWAFEFDDENRGIKEKWFLPEGNFSREIVVPFCFQSKLSGINDPSFHDVIWYRRSFTVPSEWAGRRILLNFGAVDYRAEVWVNGVALAFHEGGHTPFGVEITEALQQGENIVTLRVEDLSTDLSQPRGKQYWEEKSKAIFYTRTTGIWQTVWLEPVQATYIEKLRLTPHVDTGEIIVNYLLNRGSESQQVEIEIRYDGQKVAEDASDAKLVQHFATRPIGLGDVSGRLWSPEQPNLYDVTVRIVGDGRVLDEVRSYFGMRKISLENGRILLNDKPCYQKLILDQGYFPDGLLTAPSDEALKFDIEVCKEMGFNGARKHQKVEDSRYLYWADRIGFLVWGEMANCHTFTDKAVKRITSEWQEAVERDYNHPCIVVWVPLNESWGVPRLKSEPRQPAHSLGLYYLTKSLDQTRPVIANDGWELTKFDILTMHDYAGDKEELAKRYSTIENILAFEPSERALIIQGFGYNGEPVLVSEFGGIAYRKSEWEGWGYTAATDDDDFIRRYEAVVSGLLESPIVQGFCYTQITDVEQEINGLLTYDRKPKVPLEIIRAINQGKPWA